MGAPKLEDDYRIVAVLAHATENYDTDGWDIVVEAMTAEEIYWIIYKARSSKGAIQRMADHVAPMAAHRDDIVSA